MGKNIAKTVRTCRNVMGKAYIILENTCFCILISITIGCLVLSFVLVRWDNKGFFKKVNNRNYSIITTERPKFRYLMISEKYKNVISSTIFYLMDESKAKQPTLKYTGQINDHAGLEIFHKKRSKRLARDILIKNIDIQGIEIPSNPKYKYQSIILSSTITTAEIKTIRKKHKRSRVKNRTVTKNNTNNLTIKLIKSNMHKNILNRTNRLSSNCNYQAKRERNLKRIVRKLRKKSTLRHRSHHGAKHSGKIKRNQVISTELSTDHIQSFTSTRVPTENKTTVTTNKTILTVFYLQTTKSRKHTTKPHDTNPWMKADETDTASITTEPTNVFPNTSNTSYLATTPLKPITSSSSVKATISSTATISTSDVISTTSIKPTTSFTTTNHSIYSTINTSFTNKLSTAAATNFTAETTIFKIVTHTTKAAQATTTSKTFSSTSFTTEITTYFTITPRTNTINFSNAKFSSLPFPITSPRVKTTSITSTFTTRTLNTSDIIISKNKTNSPTKIVYTTISIVPSATMKTLTTLGTTSPTRWLTKTSPLIPSAVLTPISKLTKPASPIISTPTVSTNKPTTMVLTTGLKPSMRLPPKFLWKHDPTEELMSKPHMRLVIPTLPTFIGLMMIGIAMLMCLKFNSLCCILCIGVKDRH